jgi:CysZ protein
MKKTTSAPTLPTLRKQAAAHKCKTLMLSATLKALGDLLSPEFRSILWKAIGLTLLLFVVLFTAVEALLWFLTLVPWPWAETLIGVAAGLGLVFLFFFLMAPVTAMFAGLYLDTVAEKVERKHYAAGPAGRALPTLTSLRLTVQFALFVLLLNLVALPFIFTGIGAVVLVVINAYLLSREYFELAAMRVLSLEDAKALRKDNAATIFVAGFLPAFLTLVPILNLAVPLFATAYFVHLFRRVMASSH